MKKSWKKILCSLMLAPCLFWATACGKDPEDPNNLTTDLTAEQQQEAYTTLRTLASSMLENDGSKDQVYVLNSKTIFKPSVDVSTAGLTEENKLIAEQENYLLGNTVTRESKIYGAYKKNNIGYVNSIVEESDGSEEGFVRINEEDIVKYDRNRYVLYSKNGEQKTKSYVDGSYAKNAIVLDKDYFVDNNFYYQLDALFEILDEVTNFENYTGDVVDLASYFITDSKVNNADILDFSEYVNYDYKFSLTSGVYTFELTSDINLQNAPVVYLEDGYLKGTSKLKVDFDSEKITSINFNYNTDMVKHYSSESYFDGWLDQTFDSSSYLKYIESRTVGISIDFNASFDDSYYNQNVSAYVGTGENGAVQNQLTKIILIANTEIIETQAVYGSNLMTAIVDGLRGYMLINDLTFKDAIIDVREQIFVTDEDLVPSYDVEIYVRLDSASTEYETTLATINIIGFEDISGEIQLVTNRNLYDAIKAVWGLSDEQIVGIYSDAGLQNKLATSTLITEDMVVYVVLEEGWSPIPPEMM